MTAGLATIMYRNGFAASLMRMNQWVYLGVRYVGREGGKIGREGERERERERERGREGERERGREGEGREGESVYACSIVVINVVIIVFFSLGPVDWVVSE